MIMQKMYQKLILATLTIKLTDRLEITEVFAEYFNNMAANIGGHHVNKLTEEQCNNHPSVENIRRKFNNINFDFAKLNEREVQAELKNLNTKKSLH